MLFALIGLDCLEKKYLRSRTTRSILVKGTDRPGYIEELKAVLARLGISIKSISLTKDLTSNQIEVESIACNEASLCTR